jgi:hypothetical protein
VGSTLEQLRALHEDLSVRSILHALMAAGAFAAVAVVGAVLTLAGAIAWPVLLAAVVVLPAAIYVVALWVLDGG